MADTKITALAAIATVDPAADVLPIVDISDTSMAASGTTKKVTSNQILGAGGTATLASATITGAATVGTTLGVTGVSTLASVGVTGAATVGTTLLVGTNATLTNGNVILSTSGKGIDFSATASGSGTMTSELLADYEEGVFDAFFITGGGTVTINPGSNQCRYTKIGRLVTVQGDISVSSVSSPTGALLISGLPYTIATGAEGNAYSAMSVFPSGLEATATGQIVGYGVVGSVSIYMYRYEAGTIIGLAPSAKAASEFAFSMTYSV